MRHPVLPFVVSLASLEEGASQTRLEGTAEEAGVLPSEAEVDGPIRLDGNLYRADTQIEIQATVRAVIRQRCDLCAAPMASEVIAPLRLLAEKRGERDRRPEEEVRADDVGLLYHDGRSLDLGAEIREAILLEVPWHPLCRPDCRGLCPRCGKNRNEGECGCPARRESGRWDPLKKLLDEGP